MPTTTYDLHTGGAITGGPNREDLLDVVNIISPVDTPLFTMFKKVKTNYILTEWLTDTLDAAGSNAVIEGSSAVYGAATIRARLSNYAQISREAYDVSDTQRANNPAGIRDEFRYQMGKGLKQWKRDVEFEIVNGNSASGTSAVPRCARGLYRWLQGFSTRTAAALTAGSNVQEAELNATLQGIWLTGGAVDYVLCTPTQKNYISSNFQGSLNSRRTIGLPEMTVINIIDVYQSDFGTLRMLPHRWFSNAATGTGTPNVQTTTFLLQSDKWMVGFLRTPKNIPLAKIGSSERAMIEGEWTLICLHPSASGFISGHASGSNNSATN